MRAPIRIVFALLFAALTAAQAVVAAPQTPFEVAIGNAKSSMMADPDQAIVHAAEADKLARQVGDPRQRALAIAQADWLRGEALTRVNRHSEARPVIARALATVVRFAPHSKLHGDLLLADANIDRAGDDLAKALEEYQTAFDIFRDAGEARSQAKVLQSIGSIYLDARDYPRVLKYYAQSAEVYDGDPALKISAFNNLGETLKEMRRFKEAEADYRKALALAREIDSPLLEVRILTNIASAQYLSGRLLLADETANRGLARAQGHDTGWEPFLWGVKAQIAFARGDTSAARGFLARTFAGTDPTKTDLSFRTYHETAYRLFAAAGDERAALTHLTAFKRLDDEARAVAASANSALMGARFDFANQELSIANLKAGQLQRDIALERSRARIQSLILYGALGTAAIVVIGTSLAFFSIRRSRNEVRGVNVELKKALAAKTRFLATTSHEIRTPLNGILGMTQLMLHDRRLPDSQRDRVQVVYDAGNMMKALVDDILDVAKIETGNLTIENVPVELHPLLQGVARLWGDEAAAKGLSFEMVLGNCPKVMSGDPRRLRQIVFNLMSNAVKFTDKGIVRVSAEAEGTELVIGVADTGIGIAQDQQATVFESFHQVDGELTRKYGGTGLGLAICRELAHAMGGTVTVRSEIGQGSTFTVRLPLGCPAEVPANAESGVWPATLADATVLIVEPNALTRSILTASLAATAARVRGVAPEEARSACAAERPHHVVADISAFPATGDLAALAGASTRITILAAELPDTGARDALLQAGAAQILKRPIPLAELVALLNSIHGGVGGAQAIAA